MVNFGARVRDFFSVLLFGGASTSSSTKTALVSQGFYNAALDFSHLSNIAYCVDAPITPLKSDFTCGQSCVHFPDMELVHTFGGDFFSTSITGYLALDHVKKEKYVVFRGTFSIADAITDIQFQQSSFFVNVPALNTFTANDTAPEAKVDCKNCKIHDGFSKAFTETWHNIGPQLQQHLDSYPEYQLYVTGHSLGAAMALLGATSIKLKGYDPILINYGQPRVGNKAFSDYISKLWFGNGDGLEITQSRRLYRMTHWNDVFVGLPNWDGYTHSNGEVYIKGKYVNPPLKDLMACAGPENPKCYRSTFNLLAQINLLQNHLCYIDYIGYCALNVGRRELMDLPHYTGRYKYGHKTEAQFLAEGLELSN
ncbi:putative lipase [Yarrowia sp. C11]|nr:putative lipase [Yarrowia sp. E02]KAG5367630.1 putative lipase [Yarrowia sp. C11]